MCSDFGTKAWKVTSPIACFDHQQAEDEMKRLELELNDMTSLAVPELERYNRQRVLTWQSAMVKLCEAEVREAAFANV